MNLLKKILDLDSKSRKKPAKKKAPMVVLNKKTGSWQLLATGALGHSRVL